MRISFDLDDTLICTDETIPRERRPAWFRRLLSPSEPMRQGAPALMSELRDLGWEIWIYTTSLRSVSSIRRWMLSYGVALDGVINQRVHAEKLRGRPGKMPSKNPAAFGIELHIDDSEGVQIEGEHHGFAVLVIHADDQDWAHRVLDAAQHRSSSDASPIDRV